MKLENKKEIVIEKFRFGSAVPPYVAFCHRHLEKEIPGSVRDTPHKEERFLVPVDLLRLTLPSEIVGEIDSVELIYNIKP